MKTYAHMETCTWLFIPALVRITKKWKQSKCLPTENGAKNVVCQYNEILFVHKRDEVLIHAITWMNLDNGILYKRSQIQKILLTCIYMKCAESK
jgi:hypothetical protein